MQFMSKSLSYDDFRGIAISPIIENFWVLFLDRFESLYFLRQIISLVLKRTPVVGMWYILFVRSYNIYVTRDTTANICAIDLYMAFDKVNNHALFIKLIKRLCPVQLLVVKLYSDCVSCVKWDRVYSSMFIVYVYTIILLYIAFVCVIL